MMYLHRAIAFVMQTACCVTRLLLEIFPRKNYLIHKFYTQPKINETCKFVFKIIYDYNVSN